MLYSKYRDKIKSGDLLIWETRKIESKIDLLLKVYQKIGKTNFTHVGIALVLNNRVFCIEATPPVVRLIPLSLLDDFKIIHLETNWDKNYEDLLFQQLGKQYSIIDYLSTVFGMKTNTDNFYCSEFVSYFYKEIGLIADIDLGETPKSIVEYFINKLNTQPIDVQIDKGNLSEL